MSKGGTWGNAVSHPRSGEHLVPKAFLGYRRNKAIERAYFALLARPTPVPAICQLLLCLAVDPEFQEDRLADYQERFNGHWVPKFGHRAAVALYVWHVLRQSRLIDWLIRAFRLGDGL